MLQFSCNSDSETYTKDAVLRFTGLLAADGCGYFLDIDGKEYKPSNEEVIPETFKAQEAMNVEVTYEVLPEGEPYSCGMLPSNYTATIKILEISPRE